MILIDENEKNDVEFLENLENYLLKFYTKEKIPREFGLIQRDFARRMQQVRNEAETGIETVGAKTTADKVTEKLRKLDAILLQQKQKRDFKFRYNFELPGYEEKQKSSSGQNFSTTGKKKAYMSSFVKASESVRAMTKQDAADLMAKNDSLEKFDGSYKPICLD